MTDLKRQFAKVTLPLSEKFNIAVVAAVNDEETLTRNLLRSQILQDERASFHAFSGCRSASEAYNRGLDLTEEEIVVFAHQDVYLPQTWETSLRDAINVLSRRDPDWAVIGAVGTHEDGTIVGRCWSSGLGCVIGTPLNEPTEITCVDEMLIVLRRASGLRFDPNLPVFHLYGTDIVLTARVNNLRSYVVDLPIIHNSRPVKGLGGAYVLAHDYMRRKWAALLPVRTLIVPLTRSRWPMLRARLHLARTLRRRLARATDPMADPRDLAKAASFEP
jgi:hypothetical protein